MNSFKVKVCGITRIKDAGVAVKYGADILGLIFYKKSPRYISVKQAAEIIKSVPPTILWAGVFVNEPVEKIITIARKLRLDYIQLSGDENNKDILILQKAGFKVIKTYRISKDVELEKMVMSSDIIHLDNADKNQYGGSGKPFDWKIKLPKSMKNIMLAGGINIDNIEQGLRLFKPIIVDVNSGVEFKPGLKSEKKLKAFLGKCNRLRYGK